VSSAAAASQRKLTSLSAQLQPLQSKPAESKVGAESDSENDEEDEAAALDEEQSASAKDADGDTAMAGKARSRSTKEEYSSSVLKAAIAAEMVDQLQPVHKFTTCELVV